MACALLLGSQVVAGPQQSPERWLMEMAENASRLTYSGRMVYAEGDSMQAMQIFHAVKNGERRERLVHLTGEPREVVRRGDTVLCIDKINGEVALKGAGGPAGSSGEGEFSSSYAARFAALSEPYQVSFSGNGRVAGREVVLVDLQPKDDYRFGFQLALDSATRLLLRSLMVDHQGRVLERFEYTQIDIGGNIDDADLEPQLSVATAPRRGAAAQLVDARDPAAARWRVGWVPPAFTRFGGSESLSSALMYSDGLAAFSVFVDEGKGMGQNTEQRGATTAHTLLREDRNGPYSVTVVGEIPRLAAQKVAASVSRVPRR